MGVDNANLRKLFWMQGNFCVHYQWEIILSTIVLCIVLIRYANLMSISNAADLTPDTQPVRNIMGLFLYLLVGAFFQDTSVAIVSIVSVLAVAQISWWMSRLWRKGKSIVVFWTILVFIVMVLALFSAVTLFCTNRTATDLV